MLTVVVDCRRRRRAAAGASMEPPCGEETGRRLRWGADGACHALLAEEDEAVKPRGARRVRADLPGRLATTARSPLLVGAALPVGAAPPAGAPSCTTTGLACTAGAKACSSNSIAKAPESSRLRLRWRLARRSTSGLLTSRTPRRSAHGESSQEAAAHARGVAPPGVACNAWAEARPR